MSEETAVYSNITALSSAKLKGCQRTGPEKGSPSYARCQVMSEETAVYSNITALSSTKLKGCQRTGPEKGSPSYARCQDCAVVLNPWKLTALVFCIISLVLLLSVGFLTVKFGKLQSCEDNWHRHGTNCYSPSTKLNPWTLCETDCSTVGSSFLTLISEREMDFVKELTQSLSLKHGNQFWIGLYYNNIQQKWVWINGSASTLDKVDLKKPDPSNNQCKYIKSGQLHNGDCKVPAYCICKK